MTLDELVAEMKAAGVKDTDQIAYIDVTCSNDPDFPSEVQVVDLGGEASTPRLIAIQSTG